MCPKSQLQTSTILTQLSWALSMPTKNHASWVVSVNLNVHRSLCDGHLQQTFQWTQTEKVQQKTLRIVLMRRSVETSSSWSTWTVHWGNIPQGQINQTASVSCWKLKVKPARSPSYHCTELIHKDQAIVESKSEVLEKFPRIFDGISNLQLGQRYRIKLNPDEDLTHSLFTPWHVPLRVLSQVHQELDQMEAMGVISKVNKPTPWCAEMVVVPKKAGLVQICVDLKPLNESVLREAHPLLKVDETLPNFQEPSYSTN